MKKPENLLEVVNDLDETVIEDALISPAVPFKKHRIFRVMAAAALIAAMSLTVYAVHSVGQWYQNYFTATLSEDQKTFLDENVVTVAPQQPGITVESALTDGVQIYMKLHVVLPETVQLCDCEFLPVRYQPGNDMRYWESSYQGDVVTLEGDKVYNTLWYRPVEDGDSNDHTMDFLVLGMLEAPGQSQAMQGDSSKLAGKSLKVHVHDFYQVVGNSQNFREPEVNELLSGDWTFEVPMTEKSLRTRKLISEPAEASVECVNMGVGENPVTWKEGVSIPYVTVRALSVDIGFDGLQSGGTFGREIRAVLRDGGEVLLHPSWKGMDFIRYEAEAPILIDEVEQIVLGDGTILSAS